MNWLSDLSDQLLAAFLVYGYPVLGLIILAGAMGLPLPSGMVAVTAGALAAQGDLDWAMAALVIVVCSVAGDTVGYSLGRVAGREFMLRHGRWVGLNTPRALRAEAVFDRWGGVSVVVSRSLLSILAPAVSIMAGVSHYQFRRYLPYAIIGRVAWTGGYLGFGYASSESIEAAADFLGNLSGFLASLVLVGMLSFLVYRNGRTLARRKAAHVQTETDEGPGPLHAVQER